MPTRVPIIGHYQCIAIAWLMGKVLFTGTPIPLTPFQKQRLGINFRMFTQKSSDLAQRSRQRNTEHLDKPRRTRCRIISQVELRKEQPRGQLNVRTYWTTYQPAEPINIQFAHRAEKLVTKQQQPAEKRNAAECRLPGRYAKQIPGE